jgi:drug/metabolite transporter (DMT)-like permease
MLIDKIKNSTFFPVITLIFLAFIWGSSFILIKKGLIAYSPVQVGTLRIVFASIVLFPIAIKNLGPLFRDNWKQLLTIGIISNLAPAILFAIAETHMSSSLAGMLNSLTPIFTIVVGVLFYKVKINLPLAVGLGLGLVGSVILSLVGATGALGDFNIYALYVIAATILYGFAGNLIKTFVGKFDPVILVALTMLLVGPLAFGILLTTDIVHQTINHPDALFSLLSLFVLGAVGTAYALGLFNKLVHDTNAVFASSVTYLIPIAAIAWGFIDNESLFPLHFVGMGVVIVGIFLINKNK